MSLTRHPYLHARVGILAARLVPIQRLVEFAGQAVTPTTDSRQAPRESSEPLSSSEVLAQVLSGQLNDLAQVEKHLFSGFMQDFTILLRPLTGNGRAFLVYWLRKYEIANLKAIMRGKLAELPADTIRVGLTDISPFDSLPVEALLRTEDIAEMLRQLERGSYREAAGQLRQVYEKQQAFYIMEATLDHRYLAGLLRQASTVEDSQERRDLLMLVELVVERFNLLWALRYRYIYQLSPAETYYLLVPAACCRLSGQRFSELVQMPTLESALEKLDPRLRASLPSGGNLMAIEQAVEEYVRGIARSTLKYSHSALARVFAYLLLRECEVMRMLAVVKGRQLHLSTQVIRDGAALPETAVPV